VYEFEAWDNPGQITVVNRVVPSSDPGRFNLKIDGTTYAQNAPSGGSTGPVAVDAGVHSVSETAGVNTVPGNYVTGISCSDASRSNSVALGGIHVTAGGSVTCTITNTRRLYKT